MKRVRILLCGEIPLSLLGLDMEQHRLIHIPGIAQNLGQMVQVVPIHRPHIVEAHILKHAGKEAGSASRPASSYV